jgi:hypothetical protein
MAFPPASTTRTTPAKQQKRLTSFFFGGDGGTKSDQQQQQPCKRQRNASSSIAGSHRPAGSGFGACPMCQSSFPWHALERHAASCDGSTPKTTMATKTETKEAVAALQQTERKAEKTHKDTTLESKTAESDSVQNPGNSDSSNRGGNNFVSSSNKAAGRTTTTQQQQQQLSSYSQPIPGLFVYDNFLNEAEEAAILKELDDTTQEEDVPSWKPSYFNGKSFGKRWGVHCNLRDRRVDAPQHPLPNTLRDIVLPKLDKLLLQLAPNINIKHKNNNITNICIPNEANAIDYRRRQGHWLKAHVDDRALSKEPIANLSLAGDCYMTYRNQAPHRNLCVTQEKVLLKRRCLQILTGKARYDFSHGIANEDLLSDRRVSVTMRESPLTTTTLQQRTNTKNLFQKA